MSEPIKNRYDFVILFDVENGNPNGDPDAGNMSRIDPETGYGLVTDVCLKRKIRNYVETLKEDEKGYRIYIKDGVPLNRSDAEKKGTEMGRKHIVPYALYRAEGYVSANLARKTTGFSEDDLKLLWTAILNMFENDHSAARGKMAVRELIVFKHDSELGNAPAYKLFDSVAVRRKPDVDAARSYRDYTVTVADTLPEGVTCERLS